MNVLDSDCEQVPVYLERYANEAEQWRRDVRSTRAARSVPEELNTDLTPRALSTADHRRALSLSRGDIGRFSENVPMFARVWIVLHESDHSNSPQPQSTRSR